jgi:DNA-directed RNA polymerase subunit H (RpoH/RPB5)
MVVRNLAVLVWRHLPEFMRSRNLEPDAPLKSEEDYMLALASAGHIRVNSRGRRAAPAPEQVAVAIVIIAPEADAAHKGPALKKVLNGFNTETMAGPGRRDLSEVIVIVPDYTVELTNIKKTFADARNDKAATEGPRDKRCAFHMYPYSVFSLNLPAAVQVPTHELMLWEDAQAMLDRQRLEPKDLPYISQNDPPVIWAGGRPGEIVKITQASGPAMLAVSYRLVVPAT